MHNHMGRDTLLLRQMRIFGKSIRCKAAQCRLADKSIDIHSGGQVHVEENGASTRRSHDICTLDQDLLEISRAWRAFPRLEPFGPLGGVDLPPMPRDAIRPPVDFGE